MNRNDLIAAVADNAGLSKGDATKAVDSVFAAITDAMKSGDEVRLTGFGTFLVTERGASKGRNPRTGEEIQIPASKQPKFKAGKGLKDHSPADRADAEDAGRRSSPSRWRVRPDVTSARESTAVIAAGNG